MGRYHHPLPGGSVLRFGITRLASLAVCHKFFKGLFRKNISVDFESNRNFEISLDIMEK